MIEYVKIIEDDIENVYLVGGFGNYINLWLVIEIGIILKKLKSKIVFVGNSVVVGVVFVFLSCKMVYEFQEIGRKVKYIEFLNF